MPLITLKPYAGDSSIQIRHDLEAINTTLHLRWRANLAEDRAEWFVLGENAEDIAGPFPTQTSAYTALRLMVAANHPAHRGR